LYFTYHSAIEAAHVLLAVPFALTGGVYLLWLMDYNFSVAVWVGFIALFGTAVQTAVVMVIYLDEARRRKVAELGGQMTRQDLRDAVIEGALLRLRPKLMTVSTVVAGLLPIMWSSRVGAEVMKPLATPVLGGMVSSLLHVLIVTPVLFYWIHERRLRRLGPSVRLKPDTTYDGGGRNADDKADVVPGSGKTDVVPGFSRATPDDGGSNAAREATAVPVAGKTDVVSGFSKVDVGSGFSKADVGSGFSKADVGSGFGNADVMSGFSKADVGSGFGNADVVSGFGNADVVSGFSRTVIFGRTLITGLLIVIAVAAAWWAVNRQAGPNTDTGAVVETVRTDDLVITLSNAGGALRQGSNRFRVEFRSARTSELMDVGDVRLSGTMTMPGMVMTSPTTIVPAGQPGVYDVTGEYGMAGSWQMTLEWNGPAGRGSAAFDGDVQ
jgi:hypothetical protein